MSCLHSPSEFYDGCSRGKTSYTWLTKEDVNIGRKLRKWGGFPNDTLNEIKEQLVDVEDYEEAAEIRDELTLRQLDL